MTEKFIMSEHYIPDGILHDSRLCDISLKDNELTLSFGVYYNPDDYIDTSYAEKYKDFKKCHIKCKLKDEFFCDVKLETALNKKNQYKGISLSVEEFVAIAKKRLKKDDCLWQYLSTTVSPNITGVGIELSVWIKIKGAFYDNCTIILDTDEIEFIWE